MTFVFAGISCASDKAASEEEEQKAQQALEGEEKKMKEKKTEAEKQKAAAEEKAKKEKEKAEKMAEKEKEKLGSIVDVAKQTGSHTTFVSAVKAAGLAETLSEGGPYTVFAPDDKAFKALPEGKLDSLMKAENKSKLQTLLKYHVIEGKVMAKDVKSGNVETLEGSKAEIKATDEGVTYGGANVTKTDVKASNGVIHVIDKVVMPPEKKETARK